MCVVIDINTFHCVFNASSDSFMEFSPVHEWLYEQPKAKLVYGGTKYRQEMLVLRKYFGYMVELRRLKRIAEIDDVIVDSKEEEVKAKVQRADFDDAHIVAIFIASGCRVFCSKDQRADKYIKMRFFYPKGQKPPNIYRGRKHTHLLCNENLVQLRNCIR